MDNLGYSVLTNHLIDSSVTVNTIFSLLGGNRRADVTVTSMERVNAFTMEQLSC
uniref:Uncharacterized protein n=1 Tax=Octopus bimaculoides TaxID=37653 RepID=A0A0L8GVC2_OCTBM